MPVESDVGFVLDCGFVLDAAVPLLYGSVVKIPLDSIHHDTLGSCVGRSFVTAGDTSPVELVLVAIKVLGHKRSDASRDPFSLTFKGPQGLRLPQGIRVFECEGFGEIEMFITQVADGPQGAEFEAIFT